MFSLDSKASSLYSLFALKLKKKCELVDCPVRLPWYIEQRHFSACLPLWIMLSDSCQQRSCKNLVYSSLIYLLSAVSLEIIPNCRLFQFKWGSMVQRRLRALGWKHDVLCVFVQPPHQLCHTHASGALKGMTFWLLFKAALIYCFCINNGSQQEAASSTKMAHRQS